jgi:hypothetical protein
VLAKSCQERAHMLSVSSNVHRHMLQHTEQVPPPIETDITSHTVTWHCQAERKQTNTKYRSQASTAVSTHSNQAQSVTPRWKECETIQTTQQIGMWWPAHFVDGLQAHTHRCTNSNSPSACDQGGAGASMARCDTTCYKVTGFNGFVTGL